MNQTIRKRIEDINNGIVPEGYKQTPFGIFPCDWETISLGDLLDFKNGVNADKEKYNSGVKMISVMDILADGPIYYDKIRGQVDIDENTLNTYSVTYGDILFQRSSETFEDAGKSNVYLDSDKTATYSGFVIRGKKKAEYNPYFLNESLKISQVRKQIIRNAAGSQHINVGQDSLEKIIVPSALSAEQGKIAGILMKWDEAVELQEQYIQKLELRKKAIMKKLLTPKDGWKKQKLGQLCDIKTGNKNTQDSIFDGEYPFFVRSSVVERINTYAFDGEAILIPGDGNIGQIFHYINGKFDYHQRVYKISNAKNISLLYIFYYLQQHLRQRVMSLSAKATVDSLRLDMLTGMDIFYDESQIKICKALSKIDEEISLQKEKLAKIKEQRKAMQQYLLTGIVRVE